MSTRSEFWSWYSSFSERPIDTLVIGANKERHPITPGLVIDFFDGCDEIYDIIANLEPDVVFYPLRGAAPFKWVINEMHNINGITPPKTIDLRLGHTNSVDEAVEYGTKGRKEKIVDDDLNNNSHLLTGTYISALIIDEVQSGSTLSRSASLLLEGLRKRGIACHLNIVGAKDSRVFRKSTKAYKELRSNRMMTFFEVKLPVFHIDREELLDFQLLTSPIEQSVGIDKRIEMCHVLRNTESEKMFRNLALCRKYPQILLALLDPNRINLSGLEIDASLTQRIEEWINEMKSFEMQGKRNVQFDQIRNWLIEFAEISLLV